MLPISINLNILKADMFSMFFSRLDYFFQKIRRWLDMTKLGSNFRERIDLLEKKFHVSSIVYKKTESQFYEIFKSSDGSGARSSKGRLRKYAIITFY